MSYTHACQFVYACTCSYSPWSTSSWSLWVWVWMGSDMGGNCPTWFPLYISFLHKSFHPAFSVLGNQERKSLTCLNMVHNCPKTGPDPNKQGAKLSQRGLDTKTETGAIRIMAQSLCNDQWWGNEACAALIVIFDCSANSHRAPSLSPSFDDPTNVTYFLIKIVY